MVSGGDPSDRAAVALRLRRTVRDGLGFLESNAAPNVSGKRGAETFKSARAVGDEKHFYHKIP